MGIFYNSQLVGMFGLINVDKEERSVEFAYWVSIDFQGKYRADLRAVAAPDALFVGGFGGHPSGRRGGI